MTAQEQQIPLAAGFPAATDEQWEAEVRKVLNRGRPDDKKLDTAAAMAKLRTTTLDGLTIEPLYTREDAPGAIGFPAVMPFTRGSGVPTGEVDAWDVRQLHEDPDVETTKQAVLDDLERGGTSVWVRVDPDAVPTDALGEVLDAVRFDLAGVRVSSVTDQDAAARALLDLLTASGVDTATLSGNLGVDALGYAALHGTTPDLSSHRRWVAEAADLPGVTALVVDTLPYHGAGATDAQELAFAIATGIAYLRDLDEAGVDATTAAGQLEFRTSATADQFLTIARLRALRRLWARVLEECGVPAEQRGARTHAVTSPRMMSRVDPYVNMLRTTVATFGAATGGADAVTVLPFDHAVGLPSAFSRRIARNVQVIAAEESNVGRVTDPAGGSWYVENLTADLAAAAWVIVGEIEAAGGMAAALASGDVARRLDESNRARERALATRAQELTGVSAFPLAGEKPLSAKPRPDAPALAGLPQRRDAEVFERFRDAAWAHERATGRAPEVFLACLGEQRDFGARQGFASNVLLVGGIAQPTSSGGSPDEIAERAKQAGARVAVLCSSKSVYAREGVAVARALKDAGVERVFLAGRLSELGETPPDGLIDGTVAVGMDVVAFIDSTFDLLGVAR